MKNRKNKDRRGAYVSVMEANKVTSAKAFSAAAASACVRDPSLPSAAQMALSTAM